MWVPPISKVFLLTALPGLASGEQQELGVLREAQEVVISHLRAIFVQAQPGAGHRELEDRKIGLSHNNTSFQTASSGHRLTTGAQRPFKPIQGDGNSTGGSQGPAVPALNPRATWKRTQPLCSSSWQLRAATPNLHALCRARNLTLLGWLSTPHIAG